MSNPKEGNWRSQELYGNIPLCESHYISNKVKSTRYTLVSLLPKNLFEQFQRSANLWFLLVSIFQLIPFEINPVDSWTTIVPLAILIFLTLLKDAYNDYYRGEQDKHTNSEIFLCWDGSKFEELKCEEILVGNIVMTYEKQKFPADVVVLGTGSERNFFLDTSGILGETDLRAKKAVGETHGLLQNIEKEYVISRMAGLITFEQPNNDFNKFRGKLKLSGHPKAVELFDVNLAYRGSSLYGVEWTIGIVVYTGSETKSYLNIIYPPKKISQLEKKINIWVGYLLLMLLLMVIFSVLANYYLSTPIQNLPQTSVLENFVLFTILYNNIIPISLFVTMDIVRILQVFFIQRQLKGKVDFKIGDINENLGQIEYLLTDKAGTLTEKEFVLQLCVIGDNRYFKNDEEVERSQTVIDEDKPLFTKIYPDNNSGLLPKDDSSRTGIFSERISKDTSFSKLKQVLYKNDDTTLNNYLKCLAICNSVKIDNNKYFGISQDEVALVQASADLGVKLISREKYSMKIDFLGYVEEYLILASVPFLSTVKKTRILVKRNEDYLLYVKGNLEEMLKIAEELSACNIENQDTNAEKLGLRSIILGYKLIDERSVNEFLSKLESARSNPVNSEGRIELLFKDLEKDLTILGLAGVEDVVVAETVETVDLLRKAGIKIWMLSGDNEVSSVSTAHKVNLFKSEVPVLSLTNMKTENLCIKTLIKHISNQFFNDYSEQPNSRNVSIKRITGKSSHSHLKLESEDSLQIGGNLEKSIVEINQENNNNAEIMLAQHPLFKNIAKSSVSIPNFLNRAFFPNSVQYSLSIDRISFLTALENDDARNLFCCLLFGASSVCFYGLLPLDKAKIVTLVKDNFNFRPVTLAIGDGNSDIPMIQAADIGVGVRSKEKSQASNYSDIVISHFSVLKELLLLHGHWNYSRMSRSVLLFVYKNVFLTVVIFVFVFFSDYSGVSIFSSSLLVGFNLGFTTLPILVLGVFDEDLPRHKILQHPQLYSQGLYQTLFNWKKMVYAAMFSVVDGILLPLLIGFFMTGTINDIGSTEDQNIIGTSIYIGVVFTVLLQIGLETYCFSLLYVCSQLFSIFILACYLWFISLVSISGGDLVGAGQEIVATPIFIISVFIVPLILLAIHQAYVQYFSVFHPGIFEKISKSRPDQILIIKNNRLDQYSGCLGKLYRETNFNKKHFESDAFELKKKSLHFNSVFIEKQYCEFYILENIKFYKIVLVLLFALLILWTFLEAFVFNQSLYYNLMRTVMCAGFAIVVFMMWTDFFIDNYIVITITVIAIGLIVKFGSEIAFLSPGALATGVIPAITYILFNVDWLKITYLNIFSIVLYIISISIYYSYTSIYSSFLYDFLNVISYIILILSITVTSALLGYYIERTKRLEYKLMKVEEINMEKSQRILSFLLPNFVKKRVKDGARYIAEDQGTVTVLFCDIVDFDSICAEYTPVELTSFLDSVFQKFDQQCSVIGISKIETVGKTYMACSGLKDFESELDPSLKEVSHARRAVEMALSMISLAQTLPMKNGKPLQLKIGINTGPVTAGVVGYHKPQFSLVGDTVNTSSRMCSTIESPNTIQISKETYDFLENYNWLEFTEKSVEAKGKGTMKTFIVTEAKNNKGSVDSVKLGIGLNHLSTLMQHSSFNRTITDGESKRIKRRTSELMDMIELKDATQIFQRTDTEVIGEVKIIDFSCGETQKQKQFRVEKTKSNRKLMFVGIITAHITFSLLLLIAFIEYLFTDLTVLDIVIARAIIVVALFIIIILHHKIFLSRVYPIVMIIMFLAMLAVVLLDLIYSTKKENDLLALEIMYIILLLNHTSEIPLSKITWACLLFFIPWGILAGFTNNPTIHAANSAFVIVFAIINASAIYTIGNHLRIYFNLREIAEKEIDKTDKLLTQMMPPHVLENMRQDKSITDKLSDVTLLYADIVGFTAWSSDKTPKEVVGMLSELFTRFDKKCTDLGVYKVHTIGDCYVVMGYTHIENRDLAEECYRVVKMAQSMIQIINEINEENASKLNMRIGIHTGEVIAGITGTNIVRYDIYGPDVLIANKMESGGAPGKINVSDVTMNILERKFPEKIVFQFNKEISAKVVGRSHKSYFIVEDNNSEALT